MTCRRRTVLAAARAAWLALGVGVAGFAASSPASAACQLVLSEHRSGTELQRLPLDATAPEVRIAFDHSVLGTPVVDRYRFMPRAHLIEERFEGQGYGLPHGAGPGETLQRDGDGWRLQLNRVVHPLVVRPLPQQRMRLLLPGGEWPLAAFSPQAILITVTGCPALTTADAPE